MNATQFRANLFEVLRKVLSTGEPVDVELKGKHVHIVPAEPVAKGGKLGRLRPHPEVLRADPDSILHMDWSGEWHGDTGPS